MDSGQRGPQPPLGVTRERVVAALDEHVLPFVRNHGGHVAVVDVTADGTVGVRLDHACRGCPSAAVTLVAVVEGALRAHVDEAIRVVCTQIAVSPAAIARLRAFYGPRAGGNARRLPSARA